jgi:hypothetical protein
MLIAEGFHDREWAGAGSGAMLPPPDSPTQSAPEPPMIPPPPWSPLYQGDEHVELPEPEPEPEPGTQPPQRVEIPKPPWAEEER